MQPNLHGEAVIPSKFKYLLHIFSTKPLLLAQMLLRFRFWANTFFECALWEKRKFARLGWRRIGHAGGKPEVSPSQFRMLLGWNGEGFFPCQSLDDKPRGPAPNFASPSKEAVGLWLMRSQAILLTGWAPSLGTRTDAINRVTAKLLMSVHTAPGSEVVARLTFCRAEGKTRTTQVSSQTHYYFLERNEITRV